MKKKDRIYAWSRETTTKILEIVSVYNSWEELLENNYWDYYSYLTNEDDLFEVGVLIKIKNPTKAKGRLFCLMKNNAPNLKWYSKNKILCISEVKDIEDKYVKKWFYGEVFLTCRPYEAEREVKNLIS